MIFFLSKYLQLLKLQLKLRRPLLMMISMLHRRVVYEFISHTFIDIEFSVVHVQLCFKSFLFINYCVAFLPAMVATN